MGGGRSIFTFLWVVVAAAAVLVLQLMAMVDVAMAMDCKIDVWVLVRLVFGLVEIEARSIYSKLVCRLVVCCFC